MFKFSKDRSVSFFINSTFYACCDMFSNKRMFVKFIEKQQKGRNLDKI